MSESDVDELKRLLKKLNKKVSEEQKKYEWKEAEQDYREACERDRKKKMGLEEKKKKEAKV